MRGIFKGAVVGALAVAAVAAWNAPVRAASLGYGFFLGTWAGNICDSSTCHDTLETLIRNAWDGTPNANTAPFNNLGIGSDPFINQLNSAGKLDTSTGNGTGGAMEFTGDGSNKAGTWTYDPSNLPPNSDPNPTEIIDLYLLVKAGPNFSVFYYPSVAPGDDGQWTTSPETFDGAGGVGFCSGAAVDNYFGLCFKGVGKKGTNVPGISHLQGFWPRIDQPPGPDPMTPVPVPPAVLLLGTALAGLFGLRQMRRNRTA